MKWKDVEMIDGEFYVVDVRGKLRFDASSWVYSFKDDGSDRFTFCHVCAKIHTCDTRSHTNSIFGGGLICHNDEIENIRPATQEDMDYFWDYLDIWKYKYSLNTKKLRYVGGR